VLLGFIIGQWIVSVNVIPLVRTTIVGTITYL